MKPLISVIIPAYNSADTIGRAIESMLGQTYGNLEIIVVDDFSTDSTESVVRDYAKKDPRVVYYKSDFQDPQRTDARLKRNINAGYSARNLGFSKAKGELITFQDADDVSLLNRIEVQYDLLRKYSATHLTMDWMPFHDPFIGKRFDANAYMSSIDARDLVVKPDEVSALTRRAKGIAYKLFPRLARRIPFHIKRMRLVNKLFFGTLDPYPGTGNSPLFKREVIDKVRFRKLADRVWPSFMGRGADRDFNFQVAETFGNSWIVHVPLYMWHTRENNDPATMNEKFGPYIQ